MSWDCITETTPTARNAYRCEQCGTSIEVGTRYAYRRQNWERRFIVTRDHLECLEATRAYHNGYGDPDDESSPLCEIAFTDSEIEWMVTHYPVVADRLGWKIEVPS